MRRRLLNPIPPFDVVPPPVVDAAKRIFTLTRTNGTGLPPGEPVPFTAGATPAARRAWS
jgi:hypothetical protein